MTAPVDRPSPRPRRRRPSWLTDSVLRATRWTLVAAWICAFAGYLRIEGIPFDRESQLLWIATGVAAASVGKRAVASVVLDFLPLALVLIVYDHLRGLSDTLGMPTWWTPQIDLDRLLGFGQVPTVWLQEHLKYPDARWWDVAVCLCYISFFFLPYLTAGVLWLRNRSDFHRWAGRFVALSFLGFAFFALIPAAPPWAAAACRGTEVAGHPANPSCLIRPASLTPGGGLLGPTGGWHPGAHPWIERLSFKGWGELHLQIAATLLRQGQSVVDQVAAVPSLHAGGTLLFVLFMWRRVRRWWRPLLVLYVGFMAFALVYSAEHYVVDCIAGWVAAAAVHLTADRIERRRRSARARYPGAVFNPGSEPVPADALTIRNDAIVNLSKRRGFVFPSSEIYGGTRSAWDYGPLGVELKENVRRQWWRAMVTTRDDIVGLDSAVVLAPQVWVASGHVDAFVDPLTECRNCHNRFREDQLLEAYEARKGRAAEHGLADVNCPSCGVKGQFTEPRMFNGLLKTYLGPVEDESGLHYLRPETAQGIFINFTNVMTSARKKPPFGIAQTGKSFRNEITPGNFIFRTREFEQMEMEYFVEPGSDEKWHEYWLEQRWNWYTDLGIATDSLRFYEHPQEKLSHYAKRTVDIEYRFGFGGTEFAELEGIANRTDFDLTTHTKHSGVDLSYFDQEKGERWTPYVIEPAAGLTRAVLAFLLDAYTEDEAPNAKGVMEKRTVLRLDKRLAPVKAAVLPLSRNPDLSPMARDLAAQLRRNWNVEFDDAQAIGRRYRRQDEIGTPFCVTVDFDSLEDRAVTVRDRDSMAQERVSLDKVEGYLAARLPGC